MRWSVGQKRVPLRHAALSVEYRHSLRESSAWLLNKARELGINLTRRTSARTVDRVLEATVERCYQEGERLYKVTLGVLGLQRALRIAGPLLRETWAAIKGWRSLQPVKSRVPISKYVLECLLVTLMARALGELGRDRERYLAAMLCSWVCFEALLRPGEAANLLVGDVCLPDPGLPSDEAVGLVLSLRSPKTRRVWRNQCVIVKSPALLRWLAWWVEGKPRSEKLFRVARRDWAKLFAFGLELLHVSDLHYTLGSLRGGGATRLFRTTENLALLQFAGRWARQETVKSYLQEGLALQVACSASEVAKEKLAEAHAEWRLLCRPPPLPRKSLLVPRDV